MFSVLEGAEAIAGIAAHWAELYRRDPRATPYQSPGWVVGWAKHLTPSTTPIVVLVQHRGGAPLAALALVHDRAAGRSVIRPLSSPHAEYVRPVGPLSEDPTVVERLLHALDLLACDAEVIVPDIPTASELSTQLANHPLWKLTSTSRCAQISLPIAYWALPRTERRVQLRRQRRWGEMTGDGRVDYRRTRTMQELATAFDVLAEMNQRQSMTLHPAGPDISGRRWRQVIERCGPGGAFIATMAVDGRPVAAQLCLHRGSRSYSLITAMEPSKRDLAPGHALLRSLAHDLGRSGGVVLDLGRTLDDEGQIAYKSQYGPNWSTTSTYAVRPPTTTRSAPGPRKSSAAVPRPRPAGAP